MIRAEKQPEPAADGWAPFETAPPEAVDLASVARERIKLGSPLVKLCFGMECIYAVAFRQLDIEPVFWRSFPYPAIGR